MNNCTQYVVGFMFNDGPNSGELVALIKKNHPAWQAGRFNGIGGHVEQGESATEAMVREFEEETGCKTHLTNWTRFAKLRGNCGGCADGHGFVIDFFYSFGDLDRLHSTTDEQVCVMQPLALTLTNSIPNLSWLIPMALSMNLDSAETMVIEERYSRDELGRAGVYLSGGIAGLSADECNSWRVRATELLKVRTLDPMRWERNGRSHSPNEEIVDRDLRDIDECAALLVKVDEPSWGTAMEIRYAYQIGLPIVAFGSPKISSAWLEHHCNAFFNTLEEACAHINRQLIPVP